ncbi:MAG: glycosyltransferase family 39 protein [Thermoguttaceae bacterium]
MTSQQASRTFWILAAAHLLFWTFFPWWMQPSSASYDAMEALAYAPEWVLGTAKHPALPFWFLETVYQATGRATWGCYLASQLCVVLGLWGVWKLSREFLSESLALVVVATTMMYRYFNLGSLNYTTSVPPVSLWCVAIYFFVVSVKYNRLRDWAFLGVVLGAGCLSKYSVFLLIATMVAAMLVYADARRFLKTVGPYLTTLIAFLLFLPHLIWTWQHDFVTVASGANSVTGHGHWSNHLVSPLEFLASQVALVLPVLIGLIPLTGYAWQYRWKSHENDDAASFTNRSLLTFLIFVPVALHALAAAVGGGHLRPAYGSPLWTLIGLWVLVNLQTTVTPQRVRQSVVTIAGVFAVTIGCYVATYQFCYTFNPNEGCRIHFPGPALASTLEDAWRERCGDVPCKWITGDWKLTCHAAYRMNDRPRVLCYYSGLDAGQTPVILSMSDADINRDGGIVVWDATNFLDGAIPEWLLVRYPCAKVAPETLSLAWQTDATPHPLCVRYAIISPPL